MMLVYLRLACLLCLLPALPPLRIWFETSMSLLMLGLLPSLLVAGTLTPFMLPEPKYVRLADALRPYAMTLLVVASMAFGVWMLPIAVDLSRMHGWVGAARDLSVWLAGVCAVIAVRTAAWPIVLFFGGNMIWMALTLGLIVVDAQVRLCANFLLPDQRVAGFGLTIYAVTSGVWLLVWVVRHTGTQDSVSEHDTIC